MEKHTLLCCEWCGDEFPIGRMETLGLCAQCYIVADEVTADALLPLPATPTDTKPAGEGA